MNKSTGKYSKQPLGRILAGIGRAYLNEVNLRLNNLDIERNFYALIIIEEAKGMITQQELADLIERDKVTVVRIIDYLSENGYVVRTDDPQDKRKYRLTLTEKAKKHLPTIKKSIAEVTEKSLENLSAERIEEFYQTLHIIKNNLK
jgi:MarR family transcriptional regulator for hemolysin